VKVKNVLIKKELGRTRRELAFLKSHAAHLSAIMTTLEGCNLSLNVQLTTLSTVEEKFEAMPEKEGRRILHKKFDQSSMRKIQDYNFSKRSIKAKFQRI